METFNIIIETPAGSKQKFKYDRDKDAYILKKILPQGMQFPFDFGILPGTKGEDGDPLDVLVISEHATFQGCNIECRIIGAFVVEQTAPTEPNSSLRNDRFLAVPTASLIFAQVRSIGDLPSAMISQLSSFFKNYIQQEGKQLSVVQILQAQLAKNLIPNDSELEYRSFLYELFLPVEDNNGTPISSHTFKNLRECLINKFGGVTIYQRTPIKGAWDDQDGIKEDNLFVYEVTSTRQMPEFWSNLKVELEEQFCQREILIRKSRISIVES